MKVFPFGTMSVLISNMDILIFKNKRNVIKTLIGSETLTYASKIRGVITNLNLYQPTSV